MYLVGLDSVCVTLFVGMVGAVEDGSFLDCRGRMRRNTCLERRTVLIA